MKFGVHLELDSSLWHFVELLVCESKTMVQRTTKSQIFWRGQSLFKKDTQNFVGFGVRQTSKGGEGHAAQAIACTRHKQRPCNPGPAQCSPMSQPLVSFRVPRLHQHLCRTLVSLGTPTPLCSLKWCPLVSLGTPTPHVPRMVSPCVPKYTNTPCPKNGVPSCPNPKKILKNYK